MFTLQNKVALVTGAGSGIGQSIAETFAKAGAYVFVADRDTKAGADTVQRITKVAGQAEFVALDVTSEEQCASVSREVTEKKGRLDILVNNAGIGHVGTILQTTAADLDRLYSG